MAEKTKKQKEYTTDPIITTGTCKVQLNGCDSFVVTCGSAVFVLYAYNSIIHVRTTHETSGAAPQRYTRSRAIFLFFPFSIYSSTPRDHGRTVTLSRARYLLQRGDRGRLILLRIIIRRMRFSTWTSRPTRQRSCAEVVLSRTLHNMCIVCT